MITLNAIQQEHIADLFLDHCTACLSEDRAFVNWLDTGTERAQRAFVRASKRREVIEVELVERYGIDIQAATARRNNKATAA
jgi:hypothetical protein